MRHNNNTLLQSRRGVILASMTCGDVFSHLSSCWGWQMWPLVNLMTKEISLSPSLTTAAKQLPGVVNNTMPFQWASEVWKLLANKSCLLNGKCYHWRTNQSRLPKKLQNIYLRDHAWLLIVTPKKQLILKRKSREINHLKLILERQRLMPSPLKQHWSRRQLQQRARRKCTTRTVYFEQKWN